MDLPCRMRRALCCRDSTTRRLKFEGVGPAGLDGDHIGHARTDTETLQNRRTAWVESECDAVAVG
jgi:hypothetical protein